MANEPLDPCPFCECDDVRHDHPNRAPRVYCSRCRATAGSPDLWNRKLTGPLLLPRELPLERKPLLAERLLHHPLAADHPSAKPGAHIMTEAGTELRLQRLKADLEPYRGKAVGSLRIDMGEVQAILQTLDAMTTAGKATPVSGTDAVEVTQEDRDAAADLVLADGNQVIRACNIRVGSSDEAPTVQAFARHRIQSLSTRTEELAGALKPFADCAEQIDDDESDEEWAKFRLLVKDYRRAKAALDALPSDSDGDSLRAPS